jgi:hypothetical protein
LNLKKGAKTMKYTIIDYKDRYEAFANTKGQAMANAINHCVAEGLTVAHVQYNGGTTIIWYIDPDDEGMYTIYIEENA